LENTKNVVGDNIHQAGLWILWFLLVRDFGTAKAINVEKVNWQYSIHKKIDS
jgi:hypothetical protein